METPRELSAPPRWARWTLVALTLAAFAARLPGLTAEEPWFDEVFSIIVASQDLAGLWDRAVADQTSPPGYYLLLWGWTRLGGFDLAWMRLLPTLAATLTVPAMALAARATGLGWAGALVGATLAAVSPLMLAMSSELRTYAPLALVTVLTVSAAASRRPVTTAVGGLLLVASHYFGAFVVAALALATLLSTAAVAPGARTGETPVPPDPRRRLLAAIGPALPAALLLAVWVLIVLQRAGDSGVGPNAAWIDALTLRDLPSFASQVIGTFHTTAGAVVVSGALLAALAFGVRSRAWFAVAVAVVPLVLVPLATAATGRSLWVPRYLIVTLPGWWLLAALVADRARGRWKEAAIAALVAWSVPAGIAAERSRTRKTAWSAVARALTAGGPRTLCTNESFVALPLRYQALSERIPLTVLDLADCTAERAPDAMLLRPGTEASLELLAQRGATVGAGQDLGTRLPPTELRSLRWGR